MDWGFIFAFIFLMKTWNRLSCSYYLVWFSWDPNLFFWRNFLRALVISLTFDIFSFLDFVILLICTKSKSWLKMKLLPSPSDFYFRFWRSVLENLNIIACELQLTNLPTQIQRTPFNTHFFLSHSISIASLFYIIQFKWIRL
jgi:hypothetical protein